MVVMGKRHLKKIKSEMLYARKASEMRLALKQNKSRLIN
jgi:hypothetical protein